jgi:hypothetical protein
VTVKAERSGLFEGEAYSRSGVLAKDAALTAA